MTKPPVTIDEVDRAIIEQLQTDGRMPYTRLGAKVGMSEAAVRQRVQRLLELGAMQVVAVTDPMSLGLRRVAMIGVKTEGDVRRVADAMSTFDEVSYLVVTAGSFDLMAEVVAANDEALLELINDKVRSIPGVRRTETFVYLQLAKQTYEWGAR
ncbi:MAG: Lrp/AsnC family transcriptional regulator [Acidimicrobiia bacterium]